MKKIILVKKNFSSGIHITYSLLIGEIFILLILFVSVAYAAYYYGGQRVITSPTVQRTSMISHLATPSCDISPPFFINNSAFAWTKNKEGFNACTHQMNNPPIQQSYQPTETAKKAFLEKNITALIDQLAYLQTELLHLDELGKQLVEMVELDAKEFDFNLTWEGIVTEQQIMAVEDTEFIEDVSLAQNEPPPVSEQATRVAEIERSIAEVAKYIKDRRDKFEVLEGLLLRRRSGAKILPTGWPLKQGYISSRYGWRGERMHKGLDIVAPVRSEVLAVEKGVVTISENMHGYGNIVEVKHSDTYTTRYAHNQENLVKMGDTVEKGQAIALLGATGRTTGAHLHFEVREADEPLNPMEYLSRVDTFSLLETIKVSKK